MTRYEDTTLFGQRLVQACQGWGSYAFCLERLLEFLRRPLNGWLPHHLIGCIQDDRKIGCRTAS